MGGIKWEDSKLAQISRLGQEWTVSDVANNRDEYGVMIGWVGQREHDFGADMLSLRHLIDSQMEITRGQYNMWSNPEHKWGKQTNKKKQT